MRWSSEERAFAVEAYFSNRLSVIATQRAFREIFFSIGESLRQLNRKFQLQSE